MVQQCTNIHEINIDQILLAIQWFNVISHILRELPKIGDWLIFQCVAVVGLSDVKGGARVGRRARREGGLQDDNQSGSFPIQPCEPAGNPSLLVCILTFILISWRHSQLDPVSILFSPGKKSELPVDCGLWSTAQCPVLLLLSTLENTCRWRLLLLRLLKPAAVRVKDGGRSGQLGLRLPRQLPQGTHMERTHSHPHWEQITR